MRIGGAQTLPLQRESAYPLLQDPNVLAKCLMGCHHLAQIGPDEYEMKMKMIISSIQGLFAGKVRVADRNPPESFRLIVEGTGKVGFMKGEGVLTLVSQDSLTEVRYEGDVQVGGMIAGVGQRLLDTTARFIIRKFFERMSQQAPPPAPVIEPPQVIEPPSSSSG